MPVSARGRAGLAFGLALLAASAAAVPPSSATAGPASSPTAGLTLPAGYADRVNAELEQGRDRWGEALMHLPDGPSLRNVKPLLVPANHAGVTSAQSPWYYLPFTYPAPDPAQWTQQRDFALNVADGSELMSQWSDGRSPEQVVFSVGDGTERFGQAEARSGAPKLAGGYQPILVNGYRDAAGIAYTRESFATRLGDGGPVVSMVRFTATAPKGVETRKATLRVAVTTAGTDTATLAGGVLSTGGQTVLTASGRPTWTAPDLTYDLDLSRGPATVVLAIPTAPTAAPVPAATGALYDSERTRIERYWTGLLATGAKVDVPESYVTDAMRNTLLNNLVMGYNLTVGNGYESPDPSFAFDPEVAASIASLGEFGYQDRYRANIEQLVNRGQGDFFVGWERGIKMETVATYYLQTNDASLVREHLDTFKGWLADFAAQRAADPNGLLAKARYASDIPTPVYGVHHQAQVWRGLRDLGNALTLMGDGADAAGFLNQAAGLRQALVSAADRSTTTLADGSVFLPISLLDPAATAAAYDNVAATRDGSYWNLIIPYALATGLFPAGGRIATGTSDYLYRHGSLILGLTRFNLVGTDPGVCLNIPEGNWPAVPGYRSAGIDQQYGYSLMRFLADTGQADRMDLSFYGMLAHDLTPSTFVGGEGETVSPCPQFGEYYRSQYWPPLSPNNATWLQSLRGLLVAEHPDSGDAGLPRRLDLAPATPRPWLADGRHVAVDGLPTLFGPVSYRIESHLDDGYLTARVQPPAGQAGRAALGPLVLHLRAPAGHQLTRVLVGGRSVPFDRAGESVTLPAGSGAVTVRAEYRRVPVVTTEQASVTTVDDGPGAVQPGQPLPLTATVQALGAGTVRGDVDAELPAGWRVDQSSTPFSVRSDGLIGWQPVRVTVRPPADAKPGSYQVTLVAHPDGGAATSTTVTLQVARPAAGGYADLVLADQPAGYWRFGDAAGQPAGDASGNGGDGRYVGAVTPGQPGALAGDADGSVRLDGGYVDVPDSAALSVQGPYTLEAWVKDRAGGPQGVIEKYDGPARNGYLLRLVDGNKLVAMNLADTLYASPNSVASLGQTSWHHVVSVYDGQRLSVYLDGRLQSSAPVPKAPTDGQASLKIGARGDDAAVRFDGWLDEVAVYGHALSAAEIEAHYLKGLLGQPR